MGLSREQWRQRALSAESLLQERTDALNKALADLAACRAASTQNSATKGIATPGDLQNWSVDDRARYLTAMRYTGAQWVRVGLNYGWPGPGKALAAEARAAGFKVLGVLIDPSRTPMSAFQMAAFADQMVAEADAFEVWNEPNIPEFWTTPNPEVYAGVYNAAKNVIKAKRPTVPVVTGGLSPAPDTAPRIDPATFLTRAMAAGMKPDAIGWHPYCEPNLPSQPVYWSTWTKMESHPTFRQYPVWLTEFGCPTNVHGEFFQASTVKDAYRMWRSYGFTTPLFIYEGRDGGQDRANNQHFYGLLRYDWSPKPAYDALKAVV